MSRYLLWPLVGLFFSSTFFISLLLLPSFISILSRQRPSAASLLSARARFSLFESSRPSIAHFFLYSAMALCFSLLSLSFPLSCISFRPVLPAPAASSPSFCASLLRVSRASSARHARFRILPVVCSSSSLVTAPSCALLVDSPPFRLSVFLSSISGRFSSLERGPRVGRLRFPGHRRVVIVALRPR